MAGFRFRDMLGRKRAHTNYSSIKQKPLRLCHECRAWGHISMHCLDESNRRESEHHSNTDRKVLTSATVEQLAQASYCGICTSILAAYNARVRYIPDVQSRPAASISILINGPYYLQIGGPGFSSPKDLAPRLVDRSDPNYTVVELFLWLCVSSRPQAKSNHKSSALLSEYNPPDQPYEEPTLFVITPQFKFIYSNDEEGILTGIQEWDVPFFDIKLLRGWLRRCEDHPSAKCGGKEIKKEDMPLGFRVIDTIEEKIMEPRGSFRYVALSYMWAVSPGNNNQLEKGNVDVLSAPYGLRQVRLPNIITDAIVLCRDLGERYLWIDRLCIIQDDEIAKPSQINAMDTIYSSASFTIIGALNTREEVGLPGCTGRPRHPRSSVWCPAYTVNRESSGISCVETADEAINTTLWNQRGWTFQERLLSRRCLYITHHQVIYRCCQDESMELLAWQSAHLSPETHDHRDKGSSLLKDCDQPRERLSNETGNPIRSLEEITIFTRSKSMIEGSHFWRDGSIELSEYFDWVKDYSARQLSVASDAFNAFAGVSNALTEPFGCRLVFGIPEKYMATCLAWDCLGAYSPRGQIHDVPSWSWVSSSSAVIYDYNSMRGEHLLQITSLVYFYYQQPNGDLNKLAVEERWIEHEISIQELSEREELPPLTGKGIPGEWRTNQDWKLCPQNPWTTYENQTLDPNARIVAALFPGSLVFNTTVACLKIRKEQTPDNKNKRYPKIINAILTNAKDERVGTLENMDPAWIKDHCSKPGIQRLFDFAVISGCFPKYRERRNRAWDGKWDLIWELNVMMVERLPSKSFFARRVKMGKVTMCKWKDCNPRWETIILC